MANAIHAYFFPRSCQAAPLTDDDARLYDPFLLDETKSFGNLAEAFRKHYGLSSLKNWEFNLFGSSHTLDADNSVTSIIERSIELASIFSHKKPCGGDLSYIIIYFSKVPAQTQEFVTDFNDPYGATVYMY
ncbi:hypothetical protein IWW37_002771 [Coemansia sp. RSA 2050]|nr:hypothetical protein IWW37_002771 [Coemansia sp. RSA 2050]KAJ2735564.1 hypothetical protein IW152_001485 [Coemansia sp. BCRC 34962]